MFADFLKRIDGKKTYLAAIGLAGLALFQLSQGHVEMAIQTVLAAAATAGLRHATEKTETVSAPLAESPNLATEQPLSP